MILKGFNKEKQKEFSYNLTPDNYGTLTKVQTLTSMGEVKNIEMRPEVRGSGDPSDLPPYVIFVRGNHEAWGRLSEKNKDTLYFISEDNETTGELYLGDKLICSSVTIDSTLSPTSTNPVENRAVYQALQSKGDVEVDTTAGWNARRGLISVKDTIYIYTDYKQDEQGRDIPGLKVGDGMAQVVDLPFSDKLLYEHIDDMERHITNDERLFWNNKVRCYISVDDESNLIFTTN